MAIRSRCQGRSLGERRASLMADLLAGVGGVESGEELAEEFVELLLSVGRQVRPHRRWAGRSPCGWLQGRGGTRQRRVVSDMRLLRGNRPGVAGTTRPT